MLAENRENLGVFSLGYRKVLALDQSERRSEVNDVVKQRKERSAFLKILQVQKILSIAN